MATVKGDVHDIGKNIVGIVLQCNDYEVVDLGVMVPAHDILKAAVEHEVDLIGLSGLITPSLDEMVHVAKELERAGMRQPLLIGGATTSKTHTALKIQGEYDGGVVYVTDASRAVDVVGHLVSDERRPEYLSKISSDYAEVRERYVQRKGPKLLSLEDAQRNRLVIDRPSMQPKVLGRTILKEYDLTTLRDRIDWTPFLRVWELPGRWPTVLDDEKVGPQARRVVEDANRLLDTWCAEGAVTASAVFGLYPVSKCGDDLTILDPDTQEARLTFHLLRQQVPRPRRQA